VFVLFNIVTLSADAIALVAPLIAVLFGLGTAVIAREAVTAPETPG
jgi:hypothetical protein